MTLAVLVFPGATPDLLRHHLPRDAALVVAVDAGAEALRAAGRVPDLLVGDLDSVTSETAAWCERQGTRVERHPTRKAATDGELALRHALAHPRVLFLGSGGGRADHALANLYLLLRAAREVEASAIDPDARYWVAVPERPLALALPEGATVSAIPLEGAVRGITYGSMEYPLVEATLAPGETRGLSNLAGPPPQTVRVREGALLVVAPLGPP